MLTLAISRDDNLQTERQFNLLEGECMLNVGSVSANANALLADQIEGTSNGNRAMFSYRKLGDVAGSSPWKYTRSNWTSAPDTTIMLTPSTIPSGQDWVTWLRS